LTIVINKFLVCTHYKIDEIANNFIPTLMTKVCLEIITTAHNAICNPMEEYTGMKALLAREGGSVRVT